MRKYITSSNSRHVGLIDELRKWNVGRLTALTPVSDGNPSKSWNNKLAKDKLQYWPKDQPTSPILPRRYERHVHIA
jgi:hypothetical protein